MSENDRDRWASWLFEKRFGGDSKLAAELLQWLAPVRDKVLDNAQLQSGQVFLDVGTGDGLIGLGALDRLGDRGRVIFSDISDDLLRHVRVVVDERKGSGCADIVQASADDLSAIEDASVDAVTTRSVLIYVKNKKAAFAEFFRVLKPGGRISLAEPINRDMEIVVAHPPIAELQERLRSAHPAGDPDADPMSDFTERDLLQFCRDAGFLEIHIELRIDQQYREPWPWQSYLDASPNPNAETMREYLMKAFSTEQFERYEAYMKPLIESGKLMQCRAMCYLWAVKPESGAHSPNRSD